MLCNTKPFVLKNLETGEELEIQVRPITMAMKANLDEWLREQFIRRSSEGGEEISAVQMRAADTLDIVQNNWFVPSTKAAPRILWEISKPKMYFKDFETAFFNTTFWVMEGDNTAVKDRYEANVKVFSAAFEYAVRDPTKAAQTREGTPPKEIQAEKEPA